MKTNTPKLRFPEFRNASEWKEKALRRVCEINPSNDDRLPEKFIYIDLESVVDGVLERKREIERCSAPSRAQRVLRDGDVLFQMVRPYQRNNLLCDFIANNNYVASTGYAQLRPYNSSEFIFQILHTDGFVSKVLGKCTGSNYPAINSSALSDITVYVPSPLEQQKIADSLSSLDGLISTESRKLDALASYKKGLMQQLFPAEGETIPKLRFPEFRNAPAWEKKKLEEVLVERKEKNFRHLLICSVAVKKGIISQIEHLGRSFSAKDTSNYGVVHYGDIVYTKSPTGDFPYGIIKQSQLKEDVAVSPLYGVYEPQTYALGFMLHSYFEYPEHANNYLYPLIQKGAKNTINIKNQRFLENELMFPADKEESQKIANCLASLDELIAVQTEKLDGLKNFKKGMMQQLFPAVDEVSV